ncbi:hypothetical protein EDB92DRAFT_1817160 [Lactarius akahatsu]|uniref:Uncharacterized protein n=1 Tax=Lactarius akahatsu TaxID=416441 RepID=A0AAD4QCM3_9AGAM|nr:hypothetical protein EDB92DRAFT_1817160 [Lactarius akahatsu]
MPHKRGASMVNAPTWKPRQPCCSTRLGIVRPFPRKRGATGWGGLPSYAPFPRKGGGAGKWWPGVACTHMPLFCTYGVACTQCAPFRANGEGWGAGGDVPSRASILRIRGGKGRWRGRRGAMPCAPPFCANGEGWGAGGGEVEGAMGRGGGMLSRTPLPREWGRVGGQGWCALMCLHPARTGREGEVEGAMGRGGGMLSRTPLPREWGRVGPGVACPRVPPSHMYQGGVAKGEGEVPGASCPRAPLHGKGGGGADRGQGGPGATVRRGGGVPTCVPSMWHGHGGRGGAGGEWGTAGPPTLPFRANGVAREGGRHALVRPPFLHAMGQRSVRERGRGGQGLTLVRPLSALERGGGQCGGKGR